MTPEQIINKVLMGKSFMTPDIIEYGFTPKGLAYRLSQGTDFTQNNIYGTTFIKRNGLIKCPEINKMFRSIEAAKKHIQEN